MAEPLHPDELTVMRAIEARADLEAYLDAFEAGITHAEILEISADPWGFLDHFSDCYGMHPTERQLAMHQLAWILKAARQRACREALRHFEHQKPPD